MKLRRVVVMTVLLLGSVLACNAQPFLPDPAQIAELDNEDIDDIVAESRDQTYITASPDEYCPGEIVTVAWGSWQPRSCSRADFYATCNKVRIWGNVAGSISIEDAVPEGSAQVSDLPASGGGETFMIEVRDPDNHVVGDDFAYASPASGESVRHIYRLTCDPASNTWQWRLNRKEGFIQSQCMGITAFSAGGNASATRLTAPDGTTDDTTPGLTYTSDLMGFHPDEIHAETTNPGYETVIGQPCTPGDPPPVDLDFSAPAFEPVEEFYVMFSVQCLPLDQLQGDAYERCSANSVSTSGLPPGAGGGGAGEPTFTPAPGAAACGSSCTSDAQCAGLGPNPACAGGACYDAQACGGGATGGGDSGGSTGGGSVDCSAQGQKCNTDPQFGACPAGYTCSGPYDEFNYGTCQKSGCS